MNGKNENHVRELRLKVDKILSDLEFESKLQVSITVYREEVYLLKRSLRNHLKAQKEKPSLDLMNLSFTITSLVNRLENELEKRNAI